MACSHNQAKIDDLTKEIEALDQDKTDLETNILEYKNARTELNTVNCKLICANNNIIEGDNHVSSDSLYDNGVLDKMFNYVKNSVAELSDNITKCQEKITFIEQSIAAKENEINSLKGDCSSCAYAKKLALDEKQQHS